MEAVETIGVSHFMVARRSLDDDVAGNFTKWLFNAKQALGGDFPAFTKLESPDTDKAATLAVHPGALAYLDGEQKGFFERHFRIAGLHATLWFSLAVGAVAGMLLAGPSLRLAVVTPAVAAVLLAGIAAWREFASARHRH